MNASVLPAQLQTLIKQLESTNNGDQEKVLTQIKKALSEEKALSSKGPFAWSLLVCQSRNSSSLLSASASLSEKLAKLIWIACEIIHMHESKLTIKPLDFEKLLCNLANRFLEGKIVVWSCAMGSLLKERLSGGNLRRLSTGKIHLGSLFLTKAPVIPIAKDYSEDFVTLAWNCHLLWLRLQLLRMADETAELSLQVLQEYLFADGGVMEALSSHGHTKRDANDMATFFHYWRRLMALLLVRDNAAISLELQLYKLDLAVFADFDLIRAKNFVFYCSNSVAISQQLLSLFDYDLVKLSNAKEVMQVFESMPAEKLSMSSKAWDKRPANQLILNFLYATKSDYKVELKIGLDRLECSGSFEIWFVYKAGKWLLNHMGNTPFVLGIVNRLSYIRHDQTLRLIVSCLKYLSVQKLDLDLVTILETGFKRAAKLVIHFKYEEEIGPILLSIVKALACRQYQDLAVRLWNLLHSAALESILKQLTLSSESALLYAETLTSICQRIPQEFLDDLPVFTETEILKTILEGLPNRISAEKVEPMLRYIGTRENVDEQILQHTSLLAILLPQYPSYSFVWRERIICKIDSGASILLELVSQYVHEEEPINIPNDTDSILMKILKLDRFLGEVGSLVFCLLGEFDLALLLMKKIEDYRSDFFLYSSAGAKESYSELLLEHSSEFQILVGIASTATARPLMSQLYSSMDSYLRGNLLLAFTEGKSNYKQILEEIGGSSVNSFTKALEMKINLMRCIEWMIYLTLVVGSHKNFKYFIKAGAAYSKSIKSRWWKDRMSYWENYIEQARTVTPVIKNIYDYVSWIEHHLQENHATDIIGNEIQVFFDGPRSNSLSLVENVYRWGSPDQVRRAVCMELLTLSNAQQMRDLILMTISRDLFDLEFQTGLNTIFFADHHHNLLYYVTEECDFISGLVVVRIQVRPELKIVVKNLEEIIEDNKKMLFSTLPNDARRTEDKRKWWEGRYSLENRMATVCSWLDVWMRQLAIFFPHNHIEPGPELKLLLYELSSPSSPSSPSSNGSINIAMLIKIITARAIPVEDLSIILKALSFSEMLILRVMDVIKQWQMISNNNAVRDDPFATCNNNDDSDTSQVLLTMLLDPWLHIFPWESCSSLSKYHLLARMAWKGHSKTTHTFSIEKVAGVINPSGDLKRTEETLQSIIDVLPMSPLYVGSPPTSSQMRDCLASDLFLYCGHGSGELYLSVGEVAEMEKCSSTLLFGCSSGRLKKYALFNPEGPLLAFQKADAPLILANLWDVTDKDIDQLTLSFMDLLCLDERPCHLTIDKVSKSLKVARKACTLRLLNGFAPVIYFSHGTKQQSR